MPRSRKGTPCLAPSTAAASPHRLVTRLPSRFGSAGFRQASRSLRFYIEAGPQGDGDWRWHAASLSEHAVFKAAVTVVVVLSSVVVGLDTVHPVPPGVDLTFVVLFVAELGVRVYGAREFFVEDP